MRSKLLINRSGSLQTAIESGSDDEKSRRDNAPNCTDAHWITLLTAGQAVSRVEDHQKLEKSNGRMARWGSLHRCFTGHAGTLERQNDFKTPVEEEEEEEDGGGGGLYS